MSDPTTQDPAAASPGDNPPADAPPAPAPDATAPPAPAAAQTAPDAPATDVPPPPYDRTQSVEDRLFDLEEMLFEKLMPRLNAIVGEL